MALTTETFDVNFDHVRVLEIGVFARQSNTLGRSRQDHVAGFESQELAEVPDDVLDTKNHVRGVGILARFTVDETAQLQIAVIDVVGSN